MKEKNITVSVDEDTYEALIQESKSLGNFDDDLEALEAVESSRPLNQEEQLVLDTIRDALETVGQEAAEEMLDDFEAEFNSTPKVIKIDL